MVVQAFDGGIRVVDTRIYRVRKNSQVTLTDEVGDFQAGGTSFSWEDEIKVGTPNFTNEPVNSGKPVAETFLHCATKVVDINPATNRTSVVYTLKGGVATERFPYAVQVPEDRGIAQYLITFMLIT